MGVWSGRSLGALWLRPGGFLPSSIMILAGLSRLTQKLPPELLEKVLEYMPIPSILKMKQVRRLSAPIPEPLRYHLLWQVNRYLRDFIQDSSRTMYRIDIFAAGLEDNPTANLSLAEKREALDGYRAKWDTFGPIQKSHFEPSMGAFHFVSSVSGSGVFASIESPGNSIQFTTMESVSQGIPRKEWKVPLPRGLELQDFVIYPQADVLAVVGSGDGYAFQCHTPRTY